MYHILRNKHLPCRVDSFGEDPFVSNAALCYNTDFLLHCPSCDKFEVLIRLWRLKWQTSENKPSDEPFCDVSPFISEFLVVSVYFTIFCCCPCIFADVRIQMVMPSTKVQRIGEDCFFSTIAMDSISMCSQD